MRRLAKAAGIYKIDHVTATSYPGADFFLSAPSEYGTNTCVDDPNLEVEGAAAPAYSFKVYHTSGFKIFTVTESGLTATSQP